MYQYSFLQESDVTDILKKYQSDYEDTPQFSAVSKKRVNPLAPVELDLDQEKLMKLRNVPLPDILSDDQSQVDEKDAAKVSNFRWTE